MRRALVLFLAGCNSFDPTVGAFHVERPDPGVEEDSSTQPPASDAAADAITGSDAPAVDAPFVDAPVVDARDARTSISFRRDIRTLMNRAGNDPTGKGCKSCHYSTEANHQGLDLGGLDLATLGALRQGGGSTGRRIVVAGKPDESGLIQKLRGVYPYGTRMPKNGPPFWSDADVKLISDWIAEGAQGADDE
jgi:hypothetical protein